MAKNSNFHPVVNDPDRKIRNRVSRLHKRTRIQKQRLAAEIMTAGLDVVEKRMEVAE